MNKISIPTECPCCGYKLELVNEQLFCRNTACSAQLYKKIENLAKVLGIKGLGPKTIEKLNLADITELFYLDLETATEALGSGKVAEKLIDEIDRAKGADLATVLAAMSIPLVGNTASTKIASVVDSIDDITREVCKSAGLGDKVTDNLMNWLDTEFIEIREFLPFSFKSGKQVISSTGGKKVCITGKLKTFKTKAEAEQALLAAGFTPVDSVTKQTDILVDEGNSSSSKRVKAEQYGIMIITDLNDLIERNI